MRNSAWASAAPAAGSVLRQKLPRKKSEKPFSEPSARAITEAALSRRPEAKYCSDSARASARFSGEEISASEAPYMAGIAAGGVEQAVQTAVAMNENGDIGIPVPCYVEDVSTKVVKIIQSYTGVVDKMVWRKS